MLSMYLTTFSILYECSCGFDVWGMLSESTACPPKNGPPKYNGVVFEILGKQHWNFYNRIHCVQKFVEIERKDHTLSHVYNYLSKTQHGLVCVHCYLQWSSVVIHQLSYPFSWRRTLIKTRYSVLNTILFAFVLPIRQLRRCWHQLTPWTVSKKARFWKR